MKKYVSINMSVDRIVKYIVNMFKVEFFVYVLNDMNKMNYRTYDLQDSYKNVLEATRVYFYIMQNGCAVFSIINELQEQSLLNEDQVEIKKEKQIKSV